MLKILKEKVGLHSKGKSKAIFYTNTSPEVLSEIVGNKFEVIKKDF